jgi:hypothetical protein
VVPSPAGYNEITVPLLSNGVYQVVYQGLPNAQYALELAASLASPVTWTAVSTNQAGATGGVTFTFTPAGPEGFYRVRSVP